MKNTILIFALILSNICHAQRFVVDSSFGKNGLVSFPIFSYDSDQYFTRDDKGNILVNSREKLLFLNRIGMPLFGLNNNPLSYLDSTIYLSSNGIYDCGDNHLLALYQTVLDSNIQIIKKIDYNGLIDSSFGNFGLLRLSGTYGLGIANGQNYNHELLLVHHDGNLKNNDSAILNLYLIDKHGLIKEKLIQVPYPCDSLHLNIKISKPVFDQNNNCYLGFFAECFQQCELYVCKLNADLELVDDYGNNGFVHFATIQNLIPILHYLPPMQISISHDNDIYAGTASNGHNIYKINSQGILDPNYGLGRRNNSILFLNTSKRMLYFEPNDYLGYFRGDAFIVLSPTSKSLYSMVLDANATNTYAVADALLVDEDKFLVLSHGFDSKQLMLTKFKLLDGVITANEDTDSNPKPHCYVINNRIFVEGLNNDFVLANIYNITSKLISDINLIGLNEVSKDISDLVSGCYFIQLQTASHKVISYKLWLD